MKKAGAGAGNLSVFDPFSLLGLEKTYFLDAKEIEKAQKKTHPDQFAQASLEIRQEAARYSTAVNQAYLLLKDPLTRAGCLIGCENEVLPDPDFLEKIMLWKEEKEARTLDLEKVKEIQKHLFQDVEQAFMSNQLENIRTVLSKLKYIRKLL